MLPRQRCILLTWGSVKWHNKKLNYKQTQGTTWVSTIIYCCLSFKVERKLTRSPNNMDSISWKMHITPMMYPMQQRSLINVIRSSNMMWLRIITITGEAFVIDWTAAIEIICQAWNRQLRRAPANTKDRTNVLVLFIYKYMIKEFIGTSSSTIQNQIDMQCTYT